MKFTFLDSTFSFNLHTFLFVPPRISSEKFYIFLTHTFVLPAQYPNYTFKMSIHWPVVIVKYFLGNLEKKN